MHIYVLDQQFSCENTISEVETIFKQVLGMNIQIDFLEVDEVKIDEKYNEYITEHLSEIKNIRIHVKKIEEVIHDMITSVQEYVVRAIPEIDKLVDQFYLEVTPETWNSFSQLLEGIQYIVNSLEVINQHLEMFSEPNLFSVAKDNLTLRITLLQDALESKDRVWLSDVLLYEIIPGFKLLLKAIDTNINVQ